MEQNKTKQQAKPEEWFKPEHSTRWICPVCGLHFRFQPCMVNDGCRPQSDGYCNLHVKILTKMCEECLEEAMAMKEWTDEEIEEHMNEPCPDCGANRRICNHNCKC